jgi:hypothetical protein
MTRWERGVLHRGADFASCWTRNRKDPVLFVAGSGFDPRGTASLEALLKVSPRQVDLVVIDLPDAATDPAVRPRAEANRSQLIDLAETAGGAVMVHEVPEHSDRGALGRLVSHQFQRAGLLTKYAEIVIDISALPRGVFFPLVRGVLQQAHRAEGDGRRWNGDLHVAVCENPEIDAAIREDGTTPMAPIGGFGRPATATSQAGTTIWVPILGENQLARVEVINAELSHDEVCPVLPFPSADPRRGDRLVLEYRPLLFGEIEIEPRNVIYAHERNPFDLYRTLGLLHQRYRRALEVLGDVSMVLSSHSSKLLSMGVLLTGYEYQLEVQNVSPTLYGLHDEAEIDALRNADELFDLWLTGEPHAA